LKTTVESVGDLATLGARRTPGRPAIVERDGRVVTYEQLDRRTNRLANSLRGRGLSPGARVAAWMDDSAEYVELYVAAAKAGLVMVPINARVRAREATHQLLDADPAALVVTPDMHDRVTELKDAASGRLLLSTDPRGEIDAVPLEDLVTAGSAAPLNHPDRDALYILGYTSGTTGPPKGAMLTHRSVLAIARLNAMSYRLPPLSTAALTGSMSFVATVPAHIISHLYVGGSVIIMGSWDVESLLATVARHRATFTYIPSPVMTDFTVAAAADRASWASLEIVLHSASQAPADKLRALCDVVGDRFVEGLGMTENSGGLITATTRADIRGDTEARDLFRSVGRAVVESVVDLVDDDGQPVPHDGVSVGEVAMHSPALMSGYWNMPEATEAALAGGWYRSGDLAAMDPAGYLYIADRRTDLIVSGGMNVYPSEVESCVAELSGVVECAVVGVEHERWGQTVVAAVVLAPGVGLDADAIVAHCRGQLAGYKKPTRVLIFDSLPRTASLKVQRSVVRELVRERLASDFTHQTFV
jgi:fatty-acyl-CoA synthase